jgi:hypothetical protein
LFTFAELSLPRRRLVRFHGAGGDSFRLGDSVPDYDDRALCRKIALPRSLAPLGCLPDYLHSATIARMNRGPSCGGAPARRRTSLCRPVLMTVMLVAGTDLAAQIAVANIERIVTVPWQARTERDPARSATKTEIAGGQRHTSRAVVQQYRPVTIEWDPPSTGLPLTHYLFEAGRAAGATDAGIVYLPPDLTRFTFNAVEDGTYHLRLRAVNEFGTSPPSEELILECAVECGRLPGQVRQPAFHVIGRKILLTWQAPENGATVTEYIAEFGSSHGVSDLGEFATGRAVPFVAIDGVPPGTYSIRIRAAHMGRVGAPSDEVVVDVNRP